MTIYYIGCATVFLIFLNAILAAFELCLVNLRYRLLVEGDTQQTLTRPPISIVTQRAETLSRVVRLLQGASYISFGVLVYAWVRLLWSTDIDVYPMRLALVLIAGCTTHYLVVFILSRLLVQSFPSKTLALSAWVVLALDLLLRPFFNLLQKIEQTLFQRIQEPDTGLLDEFDTEVQIRALAREDVVLKPVLRNILQNALQMSELDVSDVLLPRSKVQFFDLNKPLKKNLTKARKTGHTRFPLCNGDLDKCVGLIHIKDLFRQDKDMEEVDLMRVRRNILRISLDTPIDDALQKLLRRKMHMALVTDEFGGTVGVLTLESILEELVGDIQDEFDVEEELIRQIGQDRYRISGLAPIHDVEDVLNIEIDTDEVSTFGGLITAEMGRIPDRSENLILPDYRLEITIDEVNEKRVISTITTRLPLASEDDEDA